MTPTLHNKDLLFYRRIFLSPKPGDIVIIDVPERSKRIVKRIVASEGQTLSVDLDGAVTLNGAPLYESYVDYGQAVRPYDTLFPLTVPEKRIFVLGDNRSISLDSRYEELGAVNKKNVVGEVFYVFHLFE